MWLPPLRERREDIPYLTAHSSGRRASACKTGCRADAGAERLLAAGYWEGNVRELRNVIERACILVDGEFITERELAVSMPPAAREAGINGAAGAARVSQDDAAGKDLLATVEREHIQRALVRAGGNKKAAAKMLGLSRRALYRRLERLDLSDTITRRREPAEMAEA